MSHSIGRKVSILLSGSVIAQALPVLAAPLLARLYSPEAFGQFGIFTAAASILAALANLKYDHAVLLARRHATAVHLFMVCMAVSLLLACVLGVAVVLAPDAWLHAAGFTAGRALAGWLPVSFVLAALTQSLGSLLFRQEKFGAVAKVRVVQAVASTALFLGLGAWAPTGTALIAASIVGQSLGVVMLAVLRRNDAQPKVTLRWRLLLACGARYRRFPMFTAPSDLLNALGANLPVMFIGSIFGLGTAGAYALAQRTLGTPLMMLGSAFSDAYRQSAAKSLATQGSYWQVAARTMGTLGLLAVVPALLCVAFAPLLFPLIFGASWAATGHIIQILGMVYFLRLVVSPLSYNYYLAERHSEDLVLQCVSFACTLGLFLYARASALDFTSTLFGYAAIYSLVYAVYGTRSLYFARLSLSGKPVLATAAAAP